MTSSTASERRVGVRCLDHLNLTVADLEATRAFYARVFDFIEVEHGVDDDGLPWAILQSGDALLCCYERPGYRLLDRFARKERGEHGIAHFALRLLDLPEFERRRRAHDVPLSYGDGVIRYPRSSSCYVRDPTGYAIEVVFWDDDRVGFAALT